MNVQRRLYKHEAKLLGLEPKENEANRNNARYTITKEQYNEILSFRLENTKRKLTEVVVKKDKDGNITSTVEKLQSKPIESVPDGYEIIKISTNKSTGQQWVQSKPTENKDIVKGFETPL